MFYIIYLQPHTIPSSHLSKWEIAAPAVEVGNQLKPPLCLNRHQIIIPGITSVKRGHGSLDFSVHFSDLSNLSTHMNFWKGAYLWFGLRRDVWPHAPITLRSQS